MTQPKNILIVDDSRFLRTAAASMLAHKGHTVREAPDAETALAMIAENRPDMVLLDVVLPGMSGKEMLQILRSDTHTSAIPVFLLTGLGNETDALDMNSVGANGYFMKGAMQLTNLICMIDEFLAGGTTLQSIN